MYWTSRAVSTLTDVAFRSMNTVSSSADSAATCHYPEYKSDHMISFTCCGLSELSSSQYWHSCVTSFSPPAFTQKRHFPLDFFIKMTGVPEEYMFGYNLLELVCACQRKNCDSRESRSQSAVQLLLLKFNFVRQEQETAESVTGVWLSVCLDFSNGTSRDTRWFIGLKMSRRSHLSQNE
ncbi:hypothetical protein P879_05420 [Paragonimus westermani]|uniref:Uncharacterized protein n=1 Tax=Paragonimus westermani TaxID=34504 RepID=A0A8T0DH98_9TREM|nr:hypothetical protein P879_05420 [Paragonimus westermani]